MSENMLSSALADVAGPLKDFLTKLAGADGATWLAAFNRFLRKENPWTSKFVVRWVIMLGVHKTPEAYKAAIEGSRGKKIGDWARQILKQVTCSQTQVELRLASATVAELGLKKGGTTEQLHAAILAQGGQLCPAEAGPALRLFLTDQPKGEWLWLAMEAIPGSDGGLSGFSVGRDGGGLWLYTAYGHPTFHWNPGDRVVFVVPAQVP